MGREVEPHLEARLLPRDVQQRIAARFAVGRRRVQCEREVQIIAAARLAADDPISGIAERAGDRRARTMVAA